MESCIVAPVLAFDGWLQTGNAFPGGKVEGGRWLAGTGASLIMHEEAESPNGGWVEAETARGLPHLSWSSESQGPTMRWISYDLRVRFDSAPGQGGSCGSFEAGKWKT
ncbi:hypothetical protein BBK36DRAFT_1137329 [Trichoderma citrinoviride]|uniref:Uncharacterized protein n=1 Tax=Trichoderma citrinoviride TaxID=58853 RepID=A0A2T4BMX7_9HYPO|nr:hypothetical protein BBK36DRAFT_1137329 [Trichoderma citrinoviride]PTB70668.1 hypothetical protein BBK36DRAFT_1137329 [Trichoderma citrinoviride]